MIQPTRCPAEFNRQGNTAGQTGSQPKEETQAKSIADAEDNGVRYGTGKQAQRTVLSTQQVVGQIETTQHIKTGTRNTDDRDDVVVHAMIVDESS
jgi:hypothetical protein